MSQVSNPSLKNGQLKRLLPSAARLLTPEFTRGETTYTSAECEDLLEPHAQALPLKELDAVCNAAMAKFAPGDLAADAFLAEGIHRALPLTRRDAADPGVFRYLAVVRYPELVRHRWEFRSYSGMRSHFWAPGMRILSNVFSRWWWGAELTRETTEHGEDYSLTRRIFARSALTTPIFNRASLASYRPAIAAIADELEDTPGLLAELVIKNLGKMLSVRVLESLSDDELRRVVRDALRLATSASASDVL